MYLLAVVAALSPETVSMYSSQIRTALHVGVPVACEEGFEVRYGPPVKVIGPLVSVSVPPPGVSVAKLRTANKAETEMSALATTARRLTMPDWDVRCFCIGDLLFVEWQPADRQLKIASTQVIRPCYNVMAHRIEQHIRSTQKLEALYIGRSTTKDGHP